MAAQRRPMPAYEAKVYTDIALSIPEVSIAEDGISFYTVELTSGQIQILLAGEGYSSDTVRFLSCLRCFHVHTQAR